MEIIREGRRVRHTEYHLGFSYKNDPGSGYSFPCDEHGNLLWGEMHQAGKDNYWNCVKEVYDVTADGVRKDSWTYWDPAIGRCQCGREVVLDSSWLNTCACGRDYDGSGTLLAPRAQWGEETGESLSDILSGYDPEEHY